MKNIKNSTEPSSITDTQPRHEMHNRWPRAESVQDFIDNLAAVQSRIDAACLRAGRSTSDVRLLPVSKTMDEKHIRLSGEVHGQAFGGLLRPERFTHHPEQYKAIQLKSRERISDAFKTIEAKLGKNFAVGKSLTVVDPYLLVFFNWGKGLNFNMEGNYPHYSAFSQSIADHPSVIKAMHR
jgi:glutathione S-transferase